MRSVTFTLLFIVSGWAFVRAGQVVSEFCYTPENYCSCYWDNNKIQCHVQYNFFNTSSIFVKSPPISGSSCGYFYYNCKLVNNNVELTIHSCPEWLTSKQEGGGENTYHCVKNGDIVECGVSICDVANRFCADVGKCNNPEWYVLHDDGKSVTTLTAVTIYGNLIDVLGAKQSEPRLEIRDAPAPVQ